MSDQSEYYKESIFPPSLVAGKHDFHSITETVCKVVEAPINIKWILALAVSASFLGMLGASIGYLFWEGTGIWGLNNPVGWGWAIVNFVFWVGIGHAGTLISAVLFLFRQKWRTNTKSGLQISKKPIPLQSTLYFPLKGK